LLGVGNADTTASTYSLALDPVMAPKIAGNTFVLSSNGASLTLTGTLNGLAASQTITVGDAGSNVTGGTAKTTQQALDFSNFGIKLNLSSTRAAGDTMTGSQIATKLATSTYRNLQVTGTNGEISDVRLSGVAPGTYSMKYNETGGIGSLALPSTLTGKVTALSGAGSAYGVSLVSATGDLGAGGKANITWDASGAITAISMHTAGSAYKAGDVLSIAGFTQAAGTSVIPTIAQTAAGVASVSAETQTVTFNAAAMAAGDSISIAGLTFTANQTLTTAQTLSAFTSLAAGATTGSGAQNLLGSYSGTLTGFGTGAGDGVNALVITGTTFADVGLATVSTQRRATATIAALSDIAIGKDIAPAAGSATLTMSGTVNGLATTQSLAVTQNAALSTETFNFSSFGVQFDVKSYQTQSAFQIGTALSTLNGLGGTASFGNPGQLVVSQGNNSALKFQSGPNSDAFIEVDTINIQTGTSGTYAGTASEMTTLGNRISQSGAGNLGSLGLNDTIDTWQTAFKNAAAAADSAIDYISTKRATYGSQMNRLSYVSSNLQAQSTNLQNSRSAIIDTNFASETANLTKGQIMQQAATAMLAQANQMPNVILSLLK